MTAADSGERTVRLLLPVGREPAPPARVSSARAQPSRTELVIGLLDNHKHNSAQILDRLQEHLGQQIEKIRFVRAKKPEAGKPAPKATLEALAAECHAVINGVAD
jgi:hypothetical protein